jgi:hypothetical protein
VIVHERNSYLPNVCGKLNFPREHFVCGATGGSAASVRTREISPAKVRYNIFCNE